MVDWIVCTRVMAASVYVHVLILLLPAVYSTPIQFHKSIDIERNGVLGSGKGYHREVDFSIGRNRPILGGIQERPMIEVQRPLIIQEAPTVIRQRPTTIEEQQTVYQRGRPTIIQDSPTIIHQQPIVVQEQQTLYQKQPIVGQSSFIMQNRPTIIEEESNPSMQYQGSSYQQMTSDVIEGQIVPGNTRVVEEEHEEIVDEIRQKVIRTKTPTYIQETMKQKVIREQVPEMVQEQHTHYVTETKPIYVTETKPITVTESKMVMKERERIINVPGEQIITKGPSQVTQEIGRSTYVVDQRVVGTSEQSYNSLEGPNRPTSFGFRMFNDDEDSGNEVDEKRPQELTENENVSETEEDELNEVHDEPEENSEEETPEESNEIQQPLKAKHISRSPIMWKSSKDAINKLIANYNLFGKMYPN